MRSWFRMFKFIPSQLQAKGTKQDPPEAKEEDLISDAIGEYGRWQLFMTFSLALFSVPCTFHIFSSNFTGYVAPYWCARPDNLSNVPTEIWTAYSQPHGPCSILNIDWSSVTEDDVLKNTYANDIVPTDTVECTDWEWDRSDVGDTVISEWKLVCSKANLNNVSELVFLIGVAIGGVCGGLISDKFGRKIILMEMLLLQSVLAVALIFVQSFLQYLIIKILMGLVSVSVVYAAFVLSMEIVGGKWVIVASCCNFFPVPVSYVIVSALSLAVPNWRSLHTILAIPGCFLLLMYFVIPESPRWLLYQGRTKQLMAVLHTAAKFNKRKIPKNLETTILAAPKPMPTKEFMLSLLFKNKLLKKTICLAFAWYAFNLAYYGLVLNVGNLGVGRFQITSMILGVVEIPAIALSIPIMLKAGRRLPVFLSCLVCGVAGLASEIFPLIVTSDILVTICLMLSKFSISMTNVMLPLYTAELYPTYVRNLGVGASQVSAGLALVGIPYLWKLAWISSQLPIITLATVSILGGSAVLFLPDTGESVIKNTNDNNSKEKKEIAATQNGAVVIS